MQLSSSQWGTIRQICAEQARAYLEKNYKPNAQMALNLGLDQSQIDEMARITEATARKHKKQMDGSACPTVYVPLSESQTGRYAAEMLTQVATKIVDLESKIAELKAGNSRWQSEHQIAVNEKAALQKRFDRQLLANEEQNDRLRQADLLIRQMNAKVLEQAQSIRQLTDPVGEASFRNHMNCRCAVEVVNPKHQAPTLVINDFGRPHPIVNTKFNDGDKWVDLTGKETFTFFRGEWRRQSEMEAFASAKKYT